MITTPCQSCLDREAQHLAASRTGHAIMIFDLARSLSSEEIDALETMQTSWVCHRGTFDPDVLRRLESRLLCWQARNRRFVVSFWGECALGLLGRGRA